MKAIHYINQFFGQVGGEDAADAKPIFHDGIIGCSMMLNGMMPDVEVTNTIVCGDNYITNHTEEALKEIFAWLDGKEFDMFFAGPAFMAGRYGVGCGIICKAVKERYNVPVFSSMNEENPGVAEYRTEFPIFKGGRKATFMKDDLTLMAKYAEKVAKGEQLLPAADEGYFPRGIRSEIPAPGNVMAADRVIDMLVKKLKGEAFETEYPMPSFDRVEPAAAITDMKNATIALVTSGGIVPKGNPDHIEASSATKFGTYCIEGVQSVDAEHYATAHGGYDPSYANADPNRVLPVDVLREMEKEGVFKKLYGYFSTTVGNGTSTANAKKFGLAIGAQLKKDGVDAVILTST